MLEQFHFTQPLWLLALIPLLLLLRFNMHATSTSKAWDKIIDPNLLPTLLQGKRSGSGGFGKVLMAIGWLIGVIALADPVWEKIPRPIFQTNAARVLVLDLSNSMLIDDLKPNRLARAKFKVEDILSMEEEGQTGLVLFAGDAFTASPLTRDRETIRSLLKILTPQLMPAQGSRADLGLEKAHELFRQAGISNGQVLMIADGVSRSKAAIDAARELLKDGHKVSVLGVGTAAGGELKFTNNQNVSVKLEADKLKEIATQGGGEYHLISTNNADLSRVLLVHDSIENSNEDSLQEQDIKNEEWYSTGPLLVLILLPLAALAFRRGWLLNIVFVAISGGVLLHPQPVMAFNLEELWTTLSKNNEQQADYALRSQQYEKASKLSNNPLRRGSAEYKLGKYQEALQSFKQSNSVTARYNEGNTLAKLKKYEEAIEAYDEALKIDPDMADAKANKKAIEDFLKQQEQNKSEQESEKNSEDNPGENSEQNQQNADGSDGKEGENQGSQGDQQLSEQSKDAESQQQVNGQDSDKERSENAKSAKSKENDNSKKNDENQFSEANKALDQDKRDSEAAEKNGQASGSEQQDKEAQDQAENQLNDTNANADQDSNQEEQAEDEKGKKEQQNSAIKSDVEQASDLTQEEKMAAEQWLRRIPDDPGGLLRRKFRSQYQERRRNADHSEQPW